MRAPLILGRRAADPTEGPRPLPEHRYDPAVGANVVPDGRLLVHAAAPDLVADYTQTQDQSGWHTDD
ncbi:hypothetical protein [Streptomyces sp. SID3343]|uniref:hypothetical protein n=1 Tax=Streptomyces sp. SID3343 TaxID=2690260 RepID=UPI001370370D|nr:hypothetical protein [Streptomyces sp. SID3343]MYW04787.1 hypothetical protein [Streptomyces sp. SID3343]